MATLNKVRVFKRGDRPVRVIVSHYFRRPGNPNKHQSIVEDWCPTKYGMPGVWDLKTSGGTGGCVNARGWEPTYYAEWVRVG